MQTLMEVNEMCQQTDFDEEFRDMACGSADVYRADSQQNSSTNTNTKTTSTSTVSQYSFYLLIQLVFPT
jgi:hypothetical protein